MAAPSFPVAPLRVPEVLPQEQGKKSALPRASVLLTGYDAVPEQTDENPHITASGVPSYPGVVAARSRDLADTLPFGTVIKVIRPEAQDPKACGFDAVGGLIGYRVITDLTHARKVNQIDLLFDHEMRVPVGTRDVKPSTALGRCDDVVIETVGRIPLDAVPATQAELIGMLGTGAVARK